MSQKSADAFRTISEVAEWLGTPAHVLRFWESKFSQIRPVKRAGGRRYYRPADMLLLGGIKKLLHDDGMTIKGAQKLLRENGIRYVAALSQPLEEDLEEFVDGPAALEIVPPHLPQDDQVGVMDTPTGDVVSFAQNRPPKQMPEAPRDALDETNQDDVASLDEDFAAADPVPAADSPGMPDGINALSGVDMPSPTEEPTGEMPTPLPDPHPTFAQDPVPDPASTAPPTDAADTPSAPETELVEQAPLQMGFFSRSSSPSAAATPPSDSIAEPPAMDQEPEPVTSAPTEDVFPMSEPSFDESGAASASAPQGTPPLQAPGTAESELEPELVELQLTQVSVPTDPADTDIPVTPGVLSHLAQRPYLGGVQAELGPLHKRLVQLRDKIAEARQA